MTGPDPEADVLAVLDRARVPYEALACDPDAADTAVFCERYGVDPADSANTIVVASKKAPRRYAACVVLAPHRLDVNGVVKRRLDAGKVSFLAAEEAIALTGMLIGGVTPLALPESVPVWVDATVLTRPSVVIGGGSRSLKIRLSPDALLAASGGQVVPDLATR